MNDMAARNLPVLMLVFNRPDLARQVLAAIREVKPKRLFIAADGPRAGHPRDQQACQETRQIAERVDWDCDLRLLFREENLGCKKGVSTAIDWFFEHVEQGIILEDDCVPDPSFFQFCAELLSRYRDDDRVMNISGTNLLENYPCSNASYLFSMYGGIWGWATWRRAWAKFDVTMSTWSDPASRTQVRRALGSWLRYRQRERIFDAVYAGRIDSWAYIWHYTRLLHGGLTVVPYTNLVSNIGFGGEATHTHSIVNPASNLPRHQMRFPLTHPDQVSVDRRFDARHFRKAVIYGLLWTLLNVPLVIWRRLVRSR